MARTWWKAWGSSERFQAMADADLTVVVVDGSQALKDEDRQILDRARGQGRFLVAANKSDLPGAESVQDAVRVSALRGDGIDELHAKIISAVAPGGRVEQEGGFITSLRHEQLLKEARQALEHARQAVLVGIPHEMLLLDLYAALSPIDAITGATTADDILNRIFSTFCIGK